MSNGNFISSPDLNSSLPDSSYRGAINAAALKELTDRTGYSLVQNNGQRKYGGPPPDWEGPVPSKGCEVFVGKIPRDLYEDDLVPVLERAGKLYELRLMMDFSNHNRGYAFCMYTNKHDAQQAVKLLNNYEIRPGRLIGVCISIDNCRLFVGGIPKNRSREELLHEMSQISNGVTDCIMKLSASDKTKNRGFAFIEYESHRAAAMARRKLIPGKIPLWGQQIKVDWAEPEAQVDEEVMNQVKILYVSGLSLTTKEETIEQVFGQFNPKSIERVKKMKDYAFVHFYDRHDAEEAYEKLDGTTIDGAVIEVTYSKPVDKDQIRYTKNNSKSMPPLPIAPNFFEQGSNQMMGDNVANVFPGRTPGMPFMGNPNQLGQVCNQMFPYSSNGSGSTIPSVRSVGKGSAGMRGAGVKTQYNKMMAQVNQQSMAAYAAAMQRAYPNVGQQPVNPLHSAMVASRPVGKQPNEILEGLCANNGWGSPVYTLMSSATPHPNGMNQYLYRVKILMRKDQDPDGTGLSFQSPKLCSTMHEAKITAAETTLMNLIPALNDMKNVINQQNGTGGGGGHLQGQMAEHHAAAAAAIMAPEQLYESLAANSYAAAMATYAANQSAMAAASFPNQVAMFGRGGPMVGANGNQNIEGSPPLNKYL